MPITNEAYIAELEREKAELLTQLENYAEEQKAKVIIFHDQEKLLVEKDKQLVAQEEQLSESEELITKLKARIQELAKVKKVYTTTIHSDNENKELTTPKKINIAVQTEGITPNELEEQLLAKRLANLKDFGAYHEQLKEQEHLISLYQQKLRTLRQQTKSPQEKMTVIMALLIILSTIMFLK